MTRGAPAAGGTREPGFRRAWIPMLVRPRLCVPGHVLCAASPGPGSPSVTSAAHRAVQLAKGTGRMPRALRPAHSRCPGTNRAIVRGSLTLSEPHLPRGKRGHVGCHVNFVRALTYCILRSQVTCSRDTGVWPEASRGALGSHQGLLGASQAQTSLPPAGHAGLRVFSERSLYARPKPTRHEKPNCDLKMEPAP